MFKKFFPILEKFSFQKNLLLTLKLIFKYSKWLTILTVISIFLETFFYFYSLYCFKILLNLLTHFNSILFIKKSITVQLIKISVVSLLFISFQSISSYIKELNIIGLSKRIDKIIFQKALELDLEYFESPQYFDTLKRAYEEGNTRPIAILNNLLEISKNIITGIGFLTIIISVNWVLFPSIFLIVLPSYFVKVFSNRVLYNWHVKKTPSERKLNYIRSVITGDQFAKEIRVFRFGNMLIKMFNEIHNYINSEQIKIKRKTLLYETIVGVISTLGFILCIGIISFNIISDKNSIGDITLLLLALLQSFGVMQNISSNLSSLFQNSLYISSFFELISLSPKIVLSKSAQITEAKNFDIAIKNISFAYPGTDKKVLNNLSLIIPHNKIIAIVGLNGSGKSTLIKVLLRLYEPDSGEIFFGNNSINKIDIKEYRDKISVVFQDFGKFCFTAGENIYLGNPDQNYNEIEINTAAELSGASSFINTFPDKYNSMMGKLFDFGHEVSIGQWQKLALARALYKPSKFIILDEATSAIDSQAENELIKKLREDIFSRGVILISHRLSVVKHADYIYVLSNGNVVQEGTHHKLIAIEGAYLSQFKNDV